ncbi:unnamed protein product, partial [Didymodactylos carnosus]
MSSSVNSSIKNTYYQHLEALSSIKTCRGMYDMVHFLNKSTTKYDSSEIKEIIENKLREKCPQFSDIFALQRHYPLAKPIRILGCIVPLILILFGVFGNILSSLVMFKRAKRRRLSSYFYLALLAIFDTLVLLTGCLIFWIEEAFQIRPLTINEFLCKTVYFLKFLFTDISAWLIVTVSFERFIAVRYPFRSKQLLGFDTDFLETQYGYVANFTVCDLKSHKWLSYIDTGFYAVFPSICILVLNILIIITLFHSIEIRNNYLKPTSSQSTNSFDQRTLNYFQSNRVSYYYGSKLKHRQQLECNVQRS